MNSHDAYVGQMYTQLSELLDEGSCTCHQCIAELLIDKGWRPPNKAIESACFCTPGIIGTNYITINYCGTCGNEVGHE